VTGASGFVGRRVVAQALGRGWEVVAVSHSRRAATPALEAEGRLHVIEGDLADSAAWAGEVARWRPQVCIHLAWNTTPGEYRQTQQNLDLLSWSLDLFARLPRWGVEQLVGVGTSAEYDVEQGYLREATALRPDSLYAACKTALRTVGQRLACDTALRFTWLRPFYIYGPGEHPRRLVASCIRALLAGERFAAGPGDHIRDFLHVDDVAAAVLRTVEAGATGDVNVCSGRPVTVRQLLETIGGALQRRHLLAFGARAAPTEPPFIWGDASTLEALGWRASVSLEQGIEDAIAWWRKSLRAEGERA
jgi:nucleoside-diphosphate-sugar epimerase